MASRDKLKQGVRNRMGDHEPVSFLEDVLEDKAPSKKTITLPIDLIKRYEKNPRTTGNDGFEDIKESIRHRGIDQPLVVTKRPGDREYVLKKGGGTRLQALEVLWEETKDLRFFEVECVFEPYTNEMDLLVGHGIENDKRQDMKFIEAANLYMEVKVELEQQLGRELGLREAAKEITQLGLSTDHTRLGRYAYAYELHQYIPLALDAGMTRADIEKIKKYSKASKSVWMARSDDVREVEELWTQSLQKFDSPTNFDLLEVQAHFENLASEQLGIDAGTLTTEVDMILSPPGSKAVGEHSSSNDANNTQDSGSENLTQQSGSAEIAVTDPSGSPQKATPKQPALSLIPSYIDRPSNEDGGYKHACKQVEARLESWVTEYDSDPLFTAMKRVVAWIDQIFSQLKAPCQQRDEDDGVVFVDIDIDRYMCFLRDLGRELSGDSYLDYVWLRVAQSLYGPYLLDQNQTTSQDLFQIIGGSVSNETIIFITSTSRVIFADPDYFWVDECLCALEKAIYEFHGVRRSQSDPEINPLGILTQN